MKMGSVTVYKEFRFFVQNLQLICFFVQNILVVGFSAADARVHLLEVNIGRFKSMAPSHS